MTLCKRLRRYKLQCLQNGMTSDGDWRIVEVMRHIILCFCIALGKSFKGILT